jgi:acetate kinase
MKNKSIYIAVNAGSSSLKFKLYSMPDETLICSGMADRIGQKMGAFSLKVGDKKFELEQPIHNHEEGVSLLLKNLIDQRVIASFEDIAGVGHRVVQGGKYFDRSVLFTPDVEAKIESLIPLAPLHNSPNLQGYRAFSTVLPSIPHIAVFDTAFHQTMAPQDYLFPIPYDLSTIHDLRRYGFHGTSHLYLVQELKKLSSIPSQKVITLHIGSGASLAAIDNQKVVATSMGLTPLGGIMMGTRTGDIDPSVLHFAALKLNKTHEEIYALFNKQSGLLGVSGLTSDSRDLEAAHLAGHERAILANTLFVRRIADFIGQYYVRLKGANALIFTAGIGENSGFYRHLILEEIKDALGIVYDEKLNAATRGKVAKLSLPSSALEVWVIPTNEEIMIIRDTYSLSLSR